MMGQSTIPEIPTIQLPVKTPHLLSFHRVSYDRILIR